MKKSKYSIVFALVAMLIMTVTIPALASEEALTQLNPYSECEVKFTESAADGTVIMPFATYNVYADKGDTQRQSGLWYAWGWTRLVDKISGDDIRHYTKVTYYMNDGEVGVESGKAWGTGKVWNNTEDTYKHSVVRVWYGVN
ncbi:Uncharacterized [Syntrophomonas zehnderi OL-4]|uniref:Uncharacterized n=1 Tax=Syntrophomonas zehnderi OL-4 TaxID=690567 RepID=A0A0E4GBD0_9FIRM|nr:hypothetical protein [Syntrophomonas zehnderi]CFX82288.1 Uncharacterized [Syntrophomonas zehnderi OL-4]